MHQCLEPFDLCVRCIHRLFPLVGLLRVQLLGFSHTVVHGCELSRQCLILCAFLLESLRIAALRFQRSTNTDRVCSGGSFLAPFKHLNQRWIVEGLCRRQLLLSIIGERDDATSGLCKDTIRGST